MAKKKAGERSLTVAKANVHEWAKLGDKALDDATISDIEERQGRINEAAPKLNDMRAELARELASVKAAFVKTYGDAKRNGGPSVFKAWAEKNVNLTYETVRELTGFAFDAKAGKVLTEKATLAAITADREKAAQRANSNRQTTAEKIKEAVTKARKEEREKVEAEPTTFEGICRPLRNAIKSAPDKLGDLAAHLVTGLDRQLADDLAQAIMEAAEALEEGEGEGSNVVAHKPGDDKGTGDPLAIPHAFKRSKGEEKPQASAA